MEFDKIVIEITQIEGDGRLHAIAKGVSVDKEGVSDPYVTEKVLGTVTTKDRSAIIDWFIEKVEENA